MVFKDFAKQGGTTKIEDYDQLKTILDCIGAFVYIMDMETYDILFINKYAQKLWGDITGQKCWQAIQKGQTGPCEFCTNDKLLKEDGSPAGVYTWEFQNTRNNRWYDCRDSAVLWTDGRTVRLEIATDITGRKQAEEDLQCQLGLAKMVAAISAHFANMPEGELSKAIDYALQLSGEFFNVGRSYVFQFSTDGNIMDNTHEWCAPGIGPQIENLQGIAAEAIPWWMEKLNRFEAINVYCVKDMPLSAAAEKEILESQSIQSVLVVPMVFADRLTGFIGFDSVEDKKLWKEEQVTILRVLAEIISNALVRQQREEKIKTISEEYEKVFNGTQDNMFLVEVLDANTFRFVRNNLAHEKSTGLLNLSGKTPEEALGEEAGSLIASNYSRCIQAGVPISYEETLVLPAGEHTWATTLTPVFQKERVAYIVGSARDITERKKSEEALRESEQRLDGIIEFLPDATFVIDQEGKVIAWNRAIEKMTGVPEAEMLGRGNYEYAIPFYGERRPILIDLALMSDSEFDRLKDKYSRIQREGDTLIGKVYVPKTYGGRGAYLSATASRLRDTSGNIICAIETIRDITERKQAEVQLQASEDRAQRQRAALAKMFLDDAVAAGDLSAALWQVTETLADTIGVARASIWMLSEDSSQLRSLTLLDAKERNRCEEETLITSDFPRYIEAIRAGRGAYVEQAQTDPRTSELTEIYLKPLGITSMLDSGINIGGKLAGVVCLEHIGQPRQWHADEEAFATTAAAIVAQILTNADRKQAENALRESEERHRLMVENTHDIIYSLNADGVFTFVSPAWKRVVGHEVEEVLGQSFHSFVHPEDVPVCEALLQKIIETGEGLSEVGYRVRRADGVYRWHTTNATPLLDENGSFVSMVGVAHDTTDRKQVEDRIRYISFHDSLTRLFNRTFLEEEMKRLNTERQLPISIIMADLNGLKLVNDTYGHCMGDEMLRCSANILRKSCRKEDIIARWGGDEFIILLPQTTKREAEVICKRINDQCRHAYVSDVPISIALGVATKNNAEKNLVDILKEAENNMYKQKLTESRSIRSGVLNALLKTLAAKSYETEEHARRMLFVSQKIGEKIGLSDYDLNRLSLLVNLHDIGKINISEEILTKRGSLTTEEWEIIKKHPEIGFRITRATEEFAHIAEDILAHHERWDGSGYPRGLKREDIPLLARIVAIADAYEVMSNGRPYKLPLSKEEIITEYKSCSGTHFDPELVDVFLLIYYELELKHL